jgi:hypothetical protein
MNVNTILYAMEWLAKLIDFYAFIRRMWNNVVVRLVLFGLVILLIAWYFG